ncbi:hypothetical protein HPB50_028584 [Hyalomma asiaticum]|nr:hypothetical protein HPB50_028584 [Hyalomma asiaticum]
MPERRPLASSHDHPEQKPQKPRLVRLKTTLPAKGASSSQFTPVYPESPVAGPSGLSTCGRSDERVPCQETSGQKKQTSAQPHRGPNRKVYSPKTAAVIKRLKNDAQRYRKAARLKSRRKITTQEALEKLKHRVNPQFYELMSNQVALHCRKRKERRWSREVKEFALNMYFQWAKFLPPTRESAGFAIAEDPSKAVKDMEKCFVEHIGVVAHLCSVTTVLKDKLNSSLPKEIFCSEKCRLELLRQFY